MSLSLEEFGAVRPYVYRTKSLSGAHRAVVYIEDVAGSLHEFAQSVDLCVEKQMGISVSQIRGGRRFNGGTRRGMQPKIIPARYMAWAFCRFAPKIPATFTEIGAVYGYEHSTIRHGVYRLCEMIARYEGSKIDALGVAHRLRASGWTIYDPVGRMINGVSD